MVQDSCQIEVHPEENSPQRLDHLGRSQGDHRLRGWSGPSFSVPNFFWVERFNLF